jgi:uncharacterized paraquat-inducible protein A
MQEQTQTRAEQADAIARAMRERAAQAKTIGDHIWRGLCFWERVVAAGALAGLSTIIMPWSSGYLSSTWGWSVFWDSYLLVPFSYICVLALLYFSQGANREIRVLRTRWMIVIASMWTSLNLVGMYVLSQLSVLAGMFGASIKPSIGSWIFVASFIVILIGAMKLQKHLLLSKASVEKHNEQ